MITKETITEAYVFLRENNNSIPDETLDFMKDASLGALGGFKKITEEFEEVLFKDYGLTDLMILKKNGRRVKANENFTINVLLRQKLEQYGISLFGQIEASGLTFRSICLLEDFPIENEPIIKQLYGFENIVVNIQLRGFDNYSVAFDYNTNSGKCQLQRYSWQVMTDKIDFETLSNLLSHIKNKGYDHAFENPID